MSNELNVWLDKLLEDMESIQFRRKSSRRVRVDVASEALPALLELLQGHASYVHLSAISCVDWIEDDEFELVYHVLSYETQSLVSAHTRIPRNPGVYLSVYDLYQPAAFFEPLRFQILTAKQLLCNRQRIGHRIDVVNHIILLFHCHQVPHPQWAAEYRRSSHKRRLGRHRTTLAEIKMSKGQQMMNMLDRNGICIFTKPIA